MANLDGENENHEYDVSRNWRNQPPDEERQERGRRTLGWERGRDCWHWALSDGHHTSVRYRSVAVSADGRFWYTQTPITRGRSQGVERIWSHVYLRGPVDLLTAVLTVSPYRRERRDQ